MVNFVQGQANRWQQKVDYRMHIDFDVETHQYLGKQELFYFNNSPDTLQQVFYHLYFNAFQPGSMMDVRSRTLRDPDPRIGDRILKLTPEERGYIKVDRLTQDGMPVHYLENGTILEVKLANPILPKSAVLFEMTWRAQVPLQIRRSGRDNKEGIDYSMSQWYPKMCEYDVQGWHANPYVQREFYGVWGNYHVSITLDKRYMIGGTGTLVNADEIGYGYTDKKVRHGGEDKLTWHFQAMNVHDFVWAADRDYNHTSIKAEDGTTLHFFYQRDKKFVENWEALPEILRKAWPMITRRFGAYPYDQYAIIQGGDGGMEYPMATLITGKRSIGSLVGVSIHEIMHSWFQMMLATNESLYAWMDEGFTNFATSEIMNELRRLKLIPGKYSVLPYVGIYNSYRSIALSGLEEPMSMHADHFTTNTAYNAAAYTKGAVFLKQLEYVVGKDVFDQSILDYSYTWRFKHPNANDFIRIFEVNSGMELDWYREYFVNTTRTINYSIDSISSEGNFSRIHLANQGGMPMPIDIEISYVDETVSLHTIPLRMMRGEKSNDGPRLFQIEEDWPWTHRTYSFTTSRPSEDISSIRIDPTFRLADVDLSNNLLELRSN